MTRSWMDIQKEWFDRSLEDLRDWWQETALVAWRAVVGAGVTVPERGSVFGWPHQLPVRLLRAREDEETGRWSWHRARFGHIESLQTTPEEQLRREPWARGESVWDGMGGQNHTAWLLYAYRGDHDATALISFAAIARMLVYSKYIDRHDAARRQRVNGPLLAAVETAAARLMQDKKMDRWDTRHGDAWPGGLELTEVCSISTDEDAVRVAAHIYLETAPQLGLVVLAYEGEPESDAGPGPGGADVLAWPVKEKS